MSSRLKTSLARKYYKHISSTRHKIVKSFDTEFCVRPDNYIDRHLWIEGGYEKDQISYLMEQAKKNQFDCFIDIGTNFGLYSCILGVNKVVPHIYSFECDPRNLYQLYGHIAMNQLHSMVTVYPYAAGDKQEIKKFHLASNDNSGTSKITDINEDDEANVIDVEQVCPDEIFNFKDQKILMKIDVEGYEENVLKGLVNILKNNKCFIQIEILNENLALYNFFTNLGYKKIHHINTDYYFTNMGADNHE
jgi:FkbM family methyltransferase